MSRSPQVKTQQIFETEHELTDAEQQALEQKLQQASLQSQQVFDDNIGASFAADDAMAANGDQSQQVEDILNAQLPVAPSDAKSRNKVTKRSKALKWLLLTLTAIVGIETASFMVDIWLSSPVMASLYTVALTLALGIAGKVTLSEYRQLKRLKQIAKWQQDCERMNFAEQVGQAKHICQQMSAQLPDIRQNQLAISQWHQSLKDDFTDKELMDLYSAMVLENVDNQALKVISRFSCETALMVAISPLALVDMALVLWRSTRMIDQICQLYGVKLGYWSRVKLIRAVFINVIYAGTSELVADVGAAMLSLEAAGKISSRAAQGLGAGLLTGRLGLKVIQMCRPIPAPADKQKRLGDLSRQLLSHLRQALPSR